MAEKGSEDVVMRSIDGNTAKQKAAPRKKAKANAWSGIKGKTGALAGAEDLPLDVLLETCSHLSFADLFALSRSTKRFRGFLLDKDNEQLWLDAIEKEGLPAPPPELSITRFAALCFVKQCAGCGKGAEKIDWDLRLRICSKCVKQLATGFDCLSAALLSSNRGRNGERCYWKEDVAALQARADLVYSGDCWEQRRCAADKVASTRCRDRERDQEFAARCKEWSRQQEENRSSSIADLRKQRQDFILEQLKSAGHAEIDAIPVLSHTLAFKAESLTASKWKRIEAELLAVADDNLRTRLEDLQFLQQEKRRSIVMKALQAQLLQQEHPSVTPGSLFAMQPFVDFEAGRMDKAIVARCADQNGSQDKLEVVYAILRDAFEGATPLIEQWKVDTKAALVQLAGGSDESALDTAVFRCSRETCQAALVYPAFFAHECLRAARRDIEVEIGNLRDGLRRRERTYANVAIPFDAGKLAFDRQATEEARALMMRTSPSDTPNSHVDMAALGRAFKQVGRGKDTFVSRWYEVICTLQSGDSRPWKVHVSQAEWNLATAVELEEHIAAELRQRIERDAAVWRCKRCSAPFLKNQTYMHMRCLDKRTKFTLDTALVEAEFERRMAEDYVEKQLISLRSQGGLNRAYETQKFDQPW